MKKFCVFFTLIICLNVYPKIINIPQNYPLIQQGIDSALRGDTVLVHPGTYKETLRIENKVITIASLFMTTGDTSYISQTIIDGDDSRMLVYFKNIFDSTTVLAGFTLTNGSSSLGGAISCEEAHPRLAHLVIKNNTATYGGGGIYCSDSRPVLYDILLQNNKAQVGAGLYVRWSSPRLTKVTIKNNHALQCGGGFSSLVGIPRFDPNNTCNIMCNYAGYAGNDIFHIGDPITVNVDTFTVTHPTPQHVDSLGLVSLFLLHGKISQIDSDLYVSPLGDNTNSGTSSQDPLQSIALALNKIVADENSPKKIILGAGTFSPSGTGEKFPIHLPDFVSLVGDSNRSTILDGEGKNELVAFYNVSKTGIEHLVITNGAGEHGGITCYKAHPALRHLFITHNHAEKNGGGLYCEESKPILENVRLTHNKAQHGGGIYCGYYSEPALKNVTIVCNIAEEHGGGIALSEDSNVLFDAENRCNIYFNVAGFNGRELYKAYGDMVNVIVDTFTVKNPGDIHAFKLSNFSFDIRAAKSEQVESDLFVNPSGNNENSGLSPEEPLQTISRAMEKIVADSLHPRAIHLANGLYSPSRSGEQFPINMSRYVSLLGQSKEGVILDAEEMSGLLRIENNADITIQNMTLKKSAEIALRCENSDINISNLFIENNLGMGAFLFNSNVYIENVLIQNNTTGGIYIHHGSPHLKDVCIKYNKGPRGAGLSLNGAHPTFENISIVGNIAVGYDGEYNEGGGLFIVNSRITFAEESSCVIHSNHANLGKDLYLEHSEIISIPLDTFTVKNPTEIHAYPLKSFNLAINHGKLEQVDTELFVAPDGNDSNSGQTADQPLRTINMALVKILPDSLNPPTIHLANGTYQSDGLIETFPIQPADHIIIAGESRDGVILDAQNKTTVVLLQNDFGISLQNLTITNGLRAWQAGLGAYDSQFECVNVRICQNEVTESLGVGCAGLRCLNSNFILQNVLVDSNRASTWGAGGLYCIGCVGNLDNVLIQHNTAKYVAGGIYAFRSHLSFCNVKIFQNRAKSTGGGVYGTESFFSLSKTTIAENFASQGTGGIELAESDIYLDPIDRNSIYKNYGSKGSDISISDSTSFHVVLDTFTVKRPTDYHVWPRQLFTFDVLNEKVKQEETDLYVSSDGDDNNNGLLPTSPLKTIAYAGMKIYADSLNKSIIHAMPGVYSSSLTGEKFPIHLPSFATLRGTHRDSVILDGEGTPYLLHLAYRQKSAFQQLGLTGASFRCVDCYKSSPVFENVKIYKNYEDDLSVTGAALTIFNSSPLFINTIISANEARDPGYCILCDNSQPTFASVLFAQNYTRFNDVFHFAESDARFINVTASGQKSGAAHAVFRFYNSTATFVNSILWNQGNNQISFSTKSQNQKLCLSHNLIKHGSEGMQVPQTSLQWLDGNIDLNPSFQDTIDADYHLAMDSPCIGAGIDSIYIDRNRNYCPPFDLDGRTRPYPMLTHPDIGAYENERAHPVLIRSINNDLPTVFDLRQNYPNPFNPTTTIEYTIPSPAFVELEVYNILGQKVKVLVAEQKHPGHYKYTWDASAFPSGVYYYRLKANDFSDVKSFLLVK
ncbi:DUF1565 domain-containing protein [candidate division KSB1 bacterium]|nr:DUF1565 domain-containing protein [candidate division KSB1 bacterium]RQW00371.1 MAG: DUF1565 domain-containing protein [candidate division KSB1 bacterium]